MTFTEALQAMIDGKVVKFYLNSGIYRMRFNAIERYDDGEWRGADVSLNIALKYRWMECDDPSEINPAQPLDNGAKV